MDTRRDQLAKERQEKRAQHLNHVFIDSIRAGVVKGIIECLDKGVDVNIFNGYGLGLAAHYADATILEILLQRGATAGLSHALCQALEAEAEIHIIKLLMYYQADPFADQAQAFQQAIKSGDVAAVRLFTDSETSIKKTLVHIDALLQTAKDTKQTEIEKILQTLFNVQLDLNRALLEGVRDKYLIAVNDCLQQGADKNYTDEHGNTMLHYAAMNNDVEMLKLLDTPNTPLDKCNKKGHSVLYAAAKAGSVNMVQYLLQRKNVAPSLASNKHKNTPLAIAIKKGHISIIQLLMDAQPPSSNLHGKYVYLLSIATHANQPQALSYLLSRINYFAVTADAATLPTQYCVRDNKLLEEAAMVYVNYFASKAHEANIATIISDLSRYEIQSTFLVSRFILAMLNLPERFTAKFKENYINEIKKISFKQRDLIKNELYKMTNTIIDTHTRDKLCKLACDKDESNALSVFIHLSKTFRCSEGKGTLAKFSVLEERTRADRRETLRSLANTLNIAIRSNNAESRITCLQILMELFNDSDDSAVIDMIKQIDAQIPGNNLYDEFNRLLTVNVPPLYTSAPHYEEASAPPPPYHSLSHH